MMDADASSMESLRDNSEIEFMIERLRRRKAEVVGELEALHLELEAVDQAIDALIALMEPRSALMIRRTHKTRNRMGSLSARLREAAISVLETAELPLDRVELLARLLKAGIVIDKPDPAKFLSRVLWRTEELINTGDGYWLKARPLPQGLAMARS